MPLEMTRRLREGETLFLRGGYRISYEDGLYWLHLVTLAPQSFTTLPELVGVLLTEVLGTWEPGSEARR